MSKVYITKPINREEQLLILDVLVELLLEQDMKRFWLTVRYLRKATKYAKKANRLAKLMEETDKLHDELKSSLYTSVMENAVENILDQA